MVKCNTASNVRAFNGSINSVTCFLTFTSQRFGIIGLQQLGVLLLFGFMGAILYMGTVELIKAAWRYYVNKRR